jgi:hypothetical protein
MTAVKEPKTTAKTETKRTYTVQQEKDLHERHHEVETPNTVSSTPPADRYEAVKAWVDLGEYEVATDARAAIKAAKKQHGLSAGRFRALPATAARVHSSRTETKTVERWD